MIREGILTEDDRVELLEGLLVAKMTKNPPHIVATDLLQAALPRIVPAGWFVSMQNPVTMEDSEPEPDARVVRGQPRDYVGRRAGPGDAALVVEVADTSLPSDRGIKKRIYARAGIACYWIVNLSDGRLEVYDDPTGPAEEPDYRRRREYGPTDAVPLVIEGARSAASTCGSCSPDRDGGAVPGQFKHRRFGSPRDATSAVGG